MALVFRDVKGEDLTPDEVDDNFRDLDDRKLNAALLGSNSALIIKDKDGNITIVSIAEDRIMGRLAGGNIAGLTAAQIKTLIAIVISDVDGLQTALDGKAASSHTHTIANVTDLQTNLDGKAASSHTHTIANVTGLQTALDGKAATGHTHAQSDITDLETDLAAKADATDVGIARVVAEGTETLSSGSAAVSYAGLTSGDKIVLAYQGGDANVGFLYPTSFSAGAGFTITSSNGSDANDVYYQVWRANT